MLKDIEAQMTATKLEKQSLLKNVNDDDDKDSSLLQDAKDTITLAIPIFLSMLAWIGMKTTDSALLGHLSADALAAAALSDLVCVMCDSPWYFFFSLHLSQCLI